MDDYNPTPRTKLHRAPARGTYDREAVHQILDEALICHVGFVVDGQPYVIPTIHWRMGERLYVHGSVVSRMVQTLDQGVDLCVTVTLLDGLVLARSAFHHSMNYRSVVVLGRAAPVDEPAEKTAALRALVEHIAIGRWEGSRPPNEKEMQATRVMSLELNEVSAKVRTGPPNDDEEDYKLGHWAGVVPLELTAKPPIPDPNLADGIAAPDYVTNYRRPARSD